MTSDKRPASRGTVPAKPGKAGAGRPQPRSAVAAFAWLLGGAAAAMGLAGIADQGNLGVFLLCAGTAMISCPPLLKVRPGIALTALAFLLCSGSALLPARLFSVPLWRQAFAVAPDLALPGTVSAAPAETVFWLAVLVVTVLAGLFILTQPVRSRPMLILSLAAAGICGTYAVLSMLAKLPAWIYPFARAGTFGFFPNRNHTATLLVTGSVLSVGVLGVAFRERLRWAANAAVAALTPCLAGLLFFSESRGGVVFLLAGVLVWVAGLGGYRDRTVLVAVAMVLLAGGGLFLSSNRGARDRLLDSVPTVSTTAHSGKARPEEEAANEEQRHGRGILTDDRVRIYHDTLGMIRDLPVTGSGLGTFSLVFAPYRATSASTSLVLHPESDWLMVAAETGLPALACLVGLFVMVWRGWHPMRDHPFWPLRWGCMAAAAAALLHGWVDVPIHRAALGWWVMVLAGLALQPGRMPEAAGTVGETGRVTRTIFVLGGVLAVVLGAALVWAQWFGGPALPPFAADEAQKEVAATFKRGDLPGATERARQAIKVSPLAWPVYYQLGLLLIREEDTDAEIDHAFLTQRVLNPWTPLTARLQAVVWMPLDPQRSAPLFVEALARQETLWQMSRTGYSPVEYWKDLVRQTGAFPLVQDRLWEACSGRAAEFVLTWLENAEARNVKERLPQVAADEGLLARFDAGQRRRFVSVWKSKGDQAGLQSFLESHGAGWAQ